MTINSLLRTPTSRTRKADGERREDGFTLIELLVVVVIIGILIGIAIPVYLNYRKSANDKAAQSDLRGAVSTLEVCNSDNSAYPTAVTSAGVMTGCAGQTKVQISSGTVLDYAGSATAYVLVANNTNGSGKWFCYNSNSGGAVRSLASTVTSASAAQTACT